MLRNEFGIGGCRHVRTRFGVIGVATHRNPINGDIWVEFPDKPELKGWWYKPSDLKYLD